MTSAARLSSNMIENHSLFPAEFIEKSPSHNFRKPRLEFNRRYFDRLAPWYDFLLHTFAIPLFLWGSKKKHMEIISEMLERISDGKILDLGGGTGMVLEKLPPCQSYICMDISIKSLLLAQKKAGVIYPPMQKNTGRETHFLCGDALALPFENSVFDHILLFLVIHFVADTPGLFAECKRVLSPSGSIWGVTPVTGIYALHDFLWRAMAEFSYRWGEPLDENLIKASALKTGLLYEKVGVNGSAIYFRLRNAPAQEEVL